jgi:hypothetical protein
MCCSRPWNVQKGWKDVECFTLFSAMNLTDNGDDFGQDNDKDVFERRQVSFIYYRTFVNFLKISLLSFTTKLIKGFQKGPFSAIHLISEWCLGSGREIDFSFGLGAVFAFLQFEFRTPFNSDLS